MARGDSDALDIGRSDALLAGRDAGSRRGQLACEIFLERCHAGVDEKQALISLRHKRKARQTKMALALEKAQILLSEFIESRPFHDKQLLKKIKIDAVLPGTAEAAVPPGLHKTAPLCCP